MISLNVHNVLDYVIGIFLAICPWIFDFYQVEPARNVFLVLGLALIAYSLITNYRYSIAKFIPLGVHMAMDAILGLVLIISPWVFDYSTLITTGQTALHFVLGVAALALVALTDQRSNRDLANTMNETDFKKAA